MDSVLTYKNPVGNGWAGGRWGAEGDYIIHWNKKQPLCARESRERAIEHLSGQDGRRQQSETHIKCSLIRAPQ